MRLLIVTQIVDRNDPVLGFFHRWIEEFALHAEEVHVICLKEGEHSLPSHVFIHSLGKEKHASRMQYLAKFYSFIWKYRHSYDQVFVHMNPEYVVLGGLFWKLFRKEVGLWYAHGAVTLGLRVAEKMTNHIFTSTPQGCQINSSKIHIVGQGIDTEHFVAKQKIIDRGCRAITVSRISQSKNIRLLIEVFAQLRKEGSTATLTIVGVPLTVQDDIYAQSLHDLVKEQDLESLIFFKGGVTQEQLPEVLGDHTCFVNAYKNQSLDKALLEAMACELPTISSNESYQDVIRKEFSDEKHGHVLCPVVDDVASFVASIRALESFLPEQRLEIGMRLRNCVTRDHSIQALHARIAAYYREYNRCLMWYEIPVTRYKDKGDLVRSLIKPTDRVLDVGFWGQAHAPDRVTWPHKLICEITPHVWGVDIEYDESRLSDPSKYQHASAENFSFEERFDVIIALDLIEHITNPGLFLACAQRHLVPGGKIILSTPNTFNLFVLAGKLARLEPPTNPDHTFYFNRPTIFRLFEKCGWDVTSFGVVYTLGDLHIESFKKKALNLLYRFLSRYTDKFYETMVVVGEPVPGKFLE